MPQRLAGQHVSRVLTTWLSMLLCQSVGGVPGLGVLCAAPRANVAEELAIIVDSGADASLFRAHCWPKGVRPMVQCRIQGDTVELQAGHKVDGQMIDALNTERQQQIGELEKYVRKIHRGLVKTGGYVDDDGFEPSEWQHWEYLQLSNRNRDRQKLNVLTMHETSPGRPDHDEDEQMPPANTVNEGEQGLSGDTGTVLLDSGEIVQIPCEYLALRVPKSEMEDDHDSEPPEPQGGGDRTLGDIMMEAPEVDPVEGALTRRWIEKVGFRELGDLDRLDGLSCLRAKQHIMQIEKEFLEAQRRGEELPRFQGMVALRF